MSIDFYPCDLCEASDIDSMAAAWKHNYHVPGAHVCGVCAENIANAYNMQNSGRWLTWSNPPSEKPKKKKISQELAKSVHEKHAYRCVKCGTHLDLCCDHIIPEIRGGETVFENLQTMCRTCNSRKGVSVDG